MDIEVGEPKYKFSFAEQVNEFTVNGKKEKRDAKGGLVDGMQYYLALANDPRNIEKKEKYYGFERCTDPDVDVPYASNRGEGGAPIIKTMGDQLMLMHRPVALAKEEAAMYRERHEASIESNSDYSGGGGISSQFKAQFARGTAPEYAPRRNVRRGR